MILNNSVVEEKNIEDSSLNNSMNEGEGEGEDHELEKIINFQKSK